MSDNESYAEFILGLLAAQLKDCAAQYPTLAKEFTRDYTRLSSAMETHGIEFALDTLVAQRKHFDQCLSCGRLTRSHLLHSSSWKRGGTVPKLFRALYLRVFHLDGELKSTPDPNAITLLRQLLGVARKLEIDCGTPAKSEAVREFSRVDQEVRLGSQLWDALEELNPADLASLSLTEDSVKSEDSVQGTLPGLSVSCLPFGHALRIQQVADYFSACMGPFDPLDSRFRHGPGAVSDQPFDSYKYDFENWPDRLEEFFPAADFASANYLAWLDSTLYKSPDCKSRKEFAAKLCAVPKTFRTPRLIASEPTSLQWCQQSIRDFMYRRVGSSLLGNFIDFRRQSANGELALDASHTGELCTIDLSSASDRISCWLVERIFRRSPSLICGFRASRSLFVRQDICDELPQYLRLRKFSTMGNAVTFPVQSVVFLAICLGSLLYVRNLRFSPRALRTLGRTQVRVFGDDLIVPKDCVRATIEALTAFGLKVNDSKTFTEGYFRESCGVDAYRGQDVTTVSILSVPKQASPGSIVSSVDVHNNLCSRGYYYTAAFIRKTVEAIGYTNIRSLAHGSGFFGWYPNHISRDIELKTRYQRDRQVRQVRCLTPRVKQRTIPPKEGASLLQFFTEASKEVQHAVSHLGHPARRAKVSLNLCWVDVQ